MDGGDADQEGEDPDPAGSKLDQIADHVIAARMIAAEHGDAILLHFLDMTLYELASRGAVALDS